MLVSLFSKYSTSRGKKARLGVGEAKRKESPGLDLDSESWIIFHLKKIRDTKGTFHAKMGSVKDRNYMKITEQKI